MKAEANKTPFGFIEKPDTLNHRLQIMIEDEYYYRCVDCSEEFSSRTACFEVCKERLKKDGN